MKRVIKWESQHLEIDTLTGKLESPDEDNDELNEYYEEDDFGDNVQKINVQNVLSTPFGFWKVDDIMNPYKQFKLWTGHTNFTITPDVVLVIKEIPGVEVLKILTRYRFIIGVGELFDIRNVRVAIEQALSCHKDETELIKDDKVKEAVYNLQQQLSMYDKWAIYVFPNGNIDFATSEQKDFKKQLGLFKKAVDFSSGILIEGNNE